MSTDENRGKKVVTRLEKLYNGVRENPRGAVVLIAEEVADLLDYIQELEAAEYEYAVEDTAIPYPHRKTIVNDIWTTRGHADMILEKRLEQNFHSVTRMRIVKRRKAGEVEDA